MPEKDPVAELNAFVSVNRNECSNTTPFRSPRQFLQQDPDSKYIFDSDRDAPQAEICREGKKLNRKCITVRPRRPVARLEKLHPYINSYSCIPPRCLKQCRSVSDRHPSRTLLFPHIITESRIFLRSPYGPHENRNRMHPHTGGITLHHQAPREPES